MADLDAVHLGLDENEADIAEELQDFDDSFDTRSEASESGSDSSPSISSVSTVPSSIAGGSSKRKGKSNAKASAAVTPTAPPTTSVSATAATTSSSSSSSSSMTTTAAATTKSKTSKKSKRSATPVEQNGKKKKRNGTETKSKKSSHNNSIDSADKAGSPNAAEESIGGSGSSNAKKTRSKKISSNSTSSANASQLNDSNTAGGGAGSGGIGSSISGGGGSGGGNKSDGSDAEDEKPILPPLESDSESSDSDSGTQHKRNGTRVKNNTTSKSSTPEKDTGSTQKAYDYMTKLNYLFRDTRFFLIKSNNSDNVQLSKSKSVWATLPQNDANLNQAFKEARNVLLIFSVNESGKFAGFARMAAPSRRDVPQVSWVLPPSISPKALGGVIELDWICRKELSFNATLHLHNTWNEGKPVKIGRDGQEIEPKIGAELCRLFPEDEQIELTPILRKSKETARVMREKGIHVIYKPPRSLSSRGHGSRGGASHSSIGPMRHKRSYSGSHGPSSSSSSHHRPYRHQYQHQHHHHHHGMGLPPGAQFKRSGSPYLPLPGGAVSAAVELGGMPPAWERYISSAAAAEAYVADYMRTMHGQLPPLPFAPPFGAQLPQLPQLPQQAQQQTLPLPQPPTRYYDGPGAPPLPDYPPPQPMRPPPPSSFDKAPYEDFAAWKNVSMGPTPLQAGFPVYAGVSAANGSGGNEGGSSGSSGGARRRGGDYNRSGGAGASSRDSRHFGSSSGGGGGGGSNGRGERGGGQRNYRDGRR